LTVYNEGVLNKRKNNSAQEYVVRNVICTADLEQQVEITRLNDYNWGRFDIVNNYNGRVGYVKDKSMDGRTTVFLSGKLISTGARSLEKSREQLFRTKWLLQQGGFIKDVKIKPEIRNIVVTFNINKIIDFQEIVKKKTVIYEPDQFPGLIYKTSIGPTCLIFSTGKIVIVGSKSKEQIEETIQDLENTVA
jgi:transcription initiation factor TFIID TATA-box-binding protein